MAFGEHRSPDAGQCSIQQTAFSRWISENGAVDCTVVGRRFGAPNGKSFTESLY